MKQYNVGIIGATGMVGQRFATLVQCKGPGSISQKRRQEI